MRTLDHLDATGKTVLLRADLDLPLENGQVKDTTRLDFLLPTLKTLLNQAQKVIVLGHLDRPGGKVVSDLKIAPVATALASLINNPQNLEIHENLRFSPGEEANDPNFAQELASLGQIFVNDAFATSHRSHASIVGISQHLPSFLGLHFIKEITALSKVINNPQKPVIFVLGGAKVATKKPLVNKLTNAADEILLGGLLAQELASYCTPGSCLTTAQFTSDRKDISLQSAQEFAQKISTAGTVVWNGPMGVFENEKTDQGTKLIAQAINQTKAYTIIGGGDTEAAATKFNAESNIDWISTGGGAMLTYLSTGNLPGLEAINQSP